MRHTLRTVLLLIVITCTLANHIHATAAPLKQEGEIIADLGFRPDTNGFAFPNYGEAPVTNLTPAEVHRLFGDVICASIKDNTCVLTPPGEEFLEILNGIMNNGHCEGMAVLSLLFYQEQLALSDFQAEDTTELNLEDNEALQREIAFWFATQILPPTRTNKIEDKTPSEILDILINAYKDSNAIEETFTIGIFQPEFKNGHAVTPYAVMDMGNDLYRIMVYDNNMPGEERFIEVDRKANIWRYYAAINPDIPEALYEGNAETKTFMLTPTQPRLEKQICFFCEQPSAKVGWGRAQAVMQYNQIWLEGQADLLIIDDNDKRLGYVEGEMFQEIPDAFFDPMTSADLYTDDPEPVYSVPVGKPFTVTLDGKLLDSPEPSAVIMLGNGYDLVVENIVLEPGQQDIITFAPDGQSLGYKPGGNEAPTLSLGVQTDTDDYEFIVSDIEIDEDGFVLVSIDPTNGKLAISTQDNTEPALFGIELARIDEEGESIFSSDDEGLTLESGDIIYIDYAGWIGDKGQLTIEFDDGGDDTIDETITLDDTQ